MFSYIYQAFEGFERQNRYFFEGKEMVGLTLNLFLSVCPGKVKILWSNFANCRSCSLDILMFFERINLLYTEKGLKYLICEREWM